MTPELNTLVKYYNRGIYTAHELASRVIEATNEPPLPQLVAILPEVVLDEIRQHAGVPPGTRLLRIRGGTYIDIDPDKWEAEEQEHAQRWQQGLYFWRAYFDSEPTT